MQLTASSVPSSVVCDMDGVLFDTREAVMAAYADAGMVMPHDAFGLSWTEWLIPLVGEAEARRIHNLKNTLYPMYVHHIKPMPPLLLFHNEALADRVSIATAASPLAVRMLREFFHAIESHVGVSGANAETKADYLTTLGSAEGWETGVYIDDNEKLGKKIVGMANHALLTEWRFVHYTGQSLMQLEKEIAC
jgi:hypothetical protein